jgi:hypothetical protein
METPHMSDTSHERGVADEGFDLRIRIGGLCLLLRDGDRLHVLMPATPNHPDHLHHARFKHGQGDDAPHVKLGKTLDLTGLGSGDPTLGSIPKEVVSIGWVTGKKVRRKLLESLPADRVRCHVQLPAGRLADRARGAEWEIERIKDGEKKTQFMATDVFWTVKMPGTSLKLDDLVPGVPELFPENYKGRPTVHVQIVSEPAVPDTDEPKKGDPAEHFEHYYLLFDGLSGTRPLPRFQRDPDGEQLPPALRGERYGKVQCILSTASLSG